MKNICKYILIGIVVAIGGWFVSAIIGEFFNGMEYESACVFGFCMYLCVVIVICTGIIVTKLDENKGSQEPNDESRDL